MLRFWLDPLNIEEGKIHLKNHAFHHICRVCRLKKGQKLTLVSKKGQHLVEMEEIFDRTATARILKTLPHPPLKKPLIRVALSCPHFQVLENLLPKLVELGTAHFHPFISELSFFKNTKVVSSQRWDRWKRIICQAQAQSLHPEEMHIHPLQDLTFVLEKTQKSGSQAFFFYEGEGGQTIQKAFQTLSSGLEEVWLFIGSEGGFTPHEVSIFQSHGIHPITLGQQILKVETACLTVLASLKYKLNDE